MTKRCLFLFVIVLFIVSCSGPKTLVSYKENAELASKQGNVGLAVETWEKYFNSTSNEEIDGIVFANAALDAYKNKNPDLAVSWFDQARFKNYSGDKMYLTLAAIYKTQNNISKELSALEYYIENFGDTNSIVNNRLFDIYTEVDLKEKALFTWQKLNDISKNEEQKLNSYFLLNKKLENKLVCDSVSLVLLQENPENLEALEWNAKKYYWAGQNRYNSEMEKYNINRTTKNYKILLEELDAVTVDFKRALPYLQKLWKLNQGKEYAGYLANIYARFGDEKKTNFYKNYLK